MILTVSFILSLCALYLAIDNLALGGQTYSLLPEFTSTALSLISIIIAGRAYKKQKTKKKRRIPMYLVIFGSICGCISALLWLYEIVSVDGLFNI